MPPVDDDLGDRRWLGSGRGGARRRHDMATLARREVFAVDALRRHAERGEGRRRFVHHRRRPAQERVVDRRHTARSSKLDPGAVEAAVQHGQILHLAAQHMGERETAEIAVSF